MAHEEQPDLQPRFATIPDIWEMYRERDKPLTADAILAILEPLAGTSYCKRLTEGLAEIMPYRKPDALDLYSALYHRVIDAFRDQTRIAEATTCLYQLAGYSVPPENVYGAAWLADDEVMLREYRRDWLYHDYDHADYAGSLRASQFWLYKGGTLRGTIGFSLVDYEEPAYSHNFFHHAILAEGMLDRAVFTDKTRRLILALDPRQSLFRTSLPLV